MCVQGGRDRVCVCVCVCIRRVSPTCTPHHTYAPTPSPCTPPTPIHSPSQTPYPPTPHICTPPHMGNTNSHLTLYFFLHSVYIVSQPPIVVAGIFTSKPASTICPSCRQAITTQVVYRLGKLSYLLCSGMCCLGCCLIPLVLKACKDVDHYCPRCQFHIFRYKRI
uniref:LITAF domain-containing protein n=1 Tax=Crocodylus porosus TaxID=8502 RepID=A0A7M4FSV9_CROPO